MLNGASILITGGTGSFGRKLAMIAAGVLSGGAVGVAFALMVRLRGSDLNA